MRQTALLLASGLLFTAGAARAAETPAPAPTPPAPAAPSSDPTQVRPGAYVLDSAHGKITWSVSHLGFSTYYGQITDVETPRGRSSASRVSPSATAAALVAL